MVSNQPVDLGEKILTTVNNSLEHFYGKECFVSKYDIINGIHILYFTVRTPKVKVISPSHVFKYEMKMIKRDIVPYDDARTQLFSIAERFCECVNKHKFKLPDNVTLFMHNSKFNFGISIYKSLKRKKYDYTKYFNVLPQLHNKEMCTDNISRYIRNMESRESMMFSKVWTVDLNTNNALDIVHAMDIKLEPSYFNAIKDEFPHAICIKLHSEDRVEDFVHKLFRHEIMSYKKDTPIEELFYLNLIKQHNIDISVVKDLKVLMFADFDGDNNTQNRYILYRISPSYDESHRIRLFIFLKCLLELYDTEKQMKRRECMVCDGKLHLVWGNQELSQNVHLRQVSNAPRNTAEKIKQKIMQSNTNYFSVYPSHSGKDICTNEAIVLMFKDNTWSFIVEIPSIHPDLVYTINTYKNKRQNDRTYNLETFLVQILDKQNNMILFEQTISIAIEKKHEDAKIVFSEANIDIIPQRLVSSMVKVINNLYSLMGMEKV